MTVLDRDLIDELRASLGLRPLAEAMRPAARRQPWRGPNRRGLFVEGPATGGDVSGCRDHVQRAHRS